MILGTYVAENEELHREYKEFCFKLLLFKYYSIDDLYQIICTGDLKAEFNHTIISNIYKYFDSYIPRYFCSFHNTIKIDDSTLVIGINDHQEVTGIPFEGNLLEYESYFNRYVKMLLNTQVDGRCCVDDVTLQIKKCSVDEDMLNDLITLDKVKQAEIEYTKYYKSYELYHTKRKIWVKRLYLYKSKLESFLNDLNMRKEFIAFLMERKVYDYFVNDLYVENISFTSEVIKTYRNDPQHLIYWLIIFKDIRSTEILKEKPIAPKEPEYKPLIHRLMTKLSELRGIFTNHGIDYYLIIINFKKKERNCDTKIKFLEKRGCSRFNHWRSMKRNYYGYNNPQCIDM
jgi:hypothetical protein